MKLDDDVTFKDYPMDVSLPDYLDWREKDLVSQVGLIQVVFYVN